VLLHHSVPEKESVTPEMPDFGSAAECFAETNSTLLLQSAT